MSKRYFIFILLGICAVAVSAGTTNRLGRFQSGYFGWQTTAENVKKFVPYWEDPLSYTLLLEMEKTNDTQMLDTSGNGYNASNLPTFATGPAWITGSTNVVGRAEHWMSFDGSADFLQIQNNSALTMTNGENDAAFSLGLWIRNFSNPAGDTGIVTKHIGVTASEWRLTHSTVSRQLSFALYDDRPATNIQVSTVATNFFTNATEWVHIIFTYDGLKSTNGMRLFTNAILADVTYSASASYTGQKDKGCNLYLGRLATLYTACEIDGFLIVKQDLSTNLTAITNIYLNTHPLDNRRYRP